MDGWIDGNLTHLRTLFADLEGSSMVHTWMVAVEARASAFVLSSQSPVDGMLVGGVVVDGDGSGET